MTFSRSTPWSLQSNVHLQLLFTHGDGWQLGVEDYRKLGEAGFSVAVGIFS